LRGDVRIVPFRADLAPHFARLNLAWIEALFAVEQADLPAFADCEAAIVAPGGQIFFALAGPAFDVVGTCAVIRHDEDTFELAKMAVTPAFQGVGVGRRLGEAAIAFARERGARRMTLLTNSRLHPAMRLYEDLGFEQRPMPSGPGYARADVYMELTLERARIS
jgi:GNAT superfamily N-acetyltransferase